MHKSSRVRYLIWAKVNKRYTINKGVARNFSRGGLSRAQGEGSPAIFQFPWGGGSTPIFGRFNGQNERILGQGPPCQCLPTPLTINRFTILGLYYHKRPLALNHCVCACCVCCQVTPCKEQFVAVIFDHDVTVTSVAPDLTGE